ncbi:hypothetical protein PQR53_33140 [Paraburkholderia fungorum]|uniref:hypothetical protein n=1 Tax=Paraburkholderia fungorum TaxID=134537 RepID=UPI0038BC1F7F
MSNKTNIAPPKKHERIKELLARLDELEHARSGLEAYAQISNTLNEIEDAYFGDFWDLPRTFLDGTISDRLYTSQAECFRVDPQYPGVVNMVHTNEYILISRYGAIEIQKDTGERKIPFCYRKDAIIYQKPDAWGDGVWHSKNGDVLSDEPRNK